MDVRRLAKSVTVLFIMVRTMTPNECEKLEEKWRKKICVRNSTFPKCIPVEEQTLVVNSETSVSLKCNGSSPQKQLILCSSVAFVDLTMIDCQFLQFRMSTIAQGAKTVNLKYTTEDIIPIDVDFYNMGLEEIAILGARTGGYFNIRLEALDKLQRFFLHNHDISVFLYKPFRHLEHLQILSMTNGNIEILNRDLFAGLQSLKALNVSGNKIRFIESKAFSELIRLNRLDLSRNRIRNITSNMFSSLRNLLQLNLGYNLLENMPPNLFRFISKLVILDIGGNAKLKELPKGFFAGARNMYAFLASYCSLAVVDKALIHTTNTPLLTGARKFHKSVSKLVVKEFYSVKEKNTKATGNFISQTQHKWQAERVANPWGRFEFLNMSNNQIKFIEESVFDPLIRLKTIDLSNNPLHVLPKKLPFGPSDKLSFIIMKSCKLTEVPNINWSKHNLKLVEMSNNNIKNLILPIYTKDRTAIMLNNNNVLRITLDMEKTSNISPIYYLQGNDRICECNAETFHRFLSYAIREFKGMFPDADTIECHSFNSTRKLTNIWPNYISCPLQDCPSSCNCVATEDYEVYVNCSKRNLSYAPRLVPAWKTTIDLTQNQLTDLSGIDDKSWTSVTKLLLTRNFLKSLDDWTALPLLKEIALNENELRDLPESLRETVNATPYFSISLADNDWECDCNSSTFSWFTENWIKIIDYEATTCKSYSVGNSGNVEQIEEEFVFRVSCDPKSLIKLPVEKTETEDLIKITVNDLTVGLAILSIFVMMISIYACRTSILALLYFINLYPRKWHTRLSNEEKIYDVFVLSWGHNRKILKIIKRKLGGNRFRLFIYGQDSLPHIQSKEEMAYGITNSHFILLLITQHFIRSTLFQVQFLRHYRQMFTSHRRTIILLFLENVRDFAFLPDELHKLLQSEKHLRWKEIFFWKKLRYFLHDPSRSISLTEHQ